MKKLLLISFAVMITSNLFAQSNQAVYIILTSTTEKVSSGVVSVSGYDPKIDRTPMRGYFIVDLNKDYLYRFMYFNQKKDPDNPIISKPLSFLDTVNYLIDWDVIGPTLTKAEAEEVLDWVKSCIKIYFIDRRDIVNNTIQLVPVQALQETKDILI